MFKKIKYLILPMLFICFSISSLSYASSKDVEDGEGFVKGFVDEKVYLLDKEYSEFLNEVENEGFVEINSKLPERKPTGWGGLISRSTYSHKTSSGIRQYTNQGNRTAARNEFSKVGGNGEVTAYVNGSNVTYVKQTSAGNVTLYTSTSTTQGAVRPTISHAKDKIRFLGN